jgi:hypothetical protein
MSDYPREKYIDLENNPYLLGRITVHLVKDDYHVEVDIIHKESHKIFKHVDILYRQQSAEEAFIVGIQRLKKFLDYIEAVSNQEVVGDKDNKNIQ